VVRAIWNGVVLAESDDTVIVEGNHYFPVESLRSEHFVASSHRSRCFWKGVAFYFDVVVDGERNANAAWYYPEPSDAAQKITGHVAFWHGVRVESDLPAERPRSRRDETTPRSGLVARVRRRVTG